MVKVLYVNGGLMDRGGISSFMINCFQNIDKDKVKIDFAVHGDREGDRDKEIIYAGSQIFHITPKSVNYKKCQKELRAVLLKEKYDVVHSQMDAGNAFVLKIAKNQGVPIRISHSHNTEFLTTNKFRLLLGEIQKSQINKYATELWACSHLAGKWLYGDKNYKVINNGIELEKYAFDERCREEVRSSLAICEDTFVVGHVGRFDYQKNHRFIVEIADICQKKNLRVCFILVGDGNLKNSIEEEVKAAGIKNIKFVGRRNDVNKLFHAFDLFILPSFFEGFPVVGVEAQANGVRCIFSDTITKEAKINDNVEYLSIANAEVWGERIDAYLHCNNRVRPSKQMENYDIRNVAKRIEAFYVRKSKGY